MLNQIRSTLAGQRKVELIQVERLERSTVGGCRGTDYSVETVDMV